MDKYIQDQTTGESKTRFFVERFFENFVQVQALMYGCTPIAMSKVYKDGGGDSQKRYVGRASRLSSSTNPFEIFWVATADIKQATLQLTESTRMYMGYKYLLGLSAEEVGTHFGVSEKTVQRAISKALDRVTAILDGD